MCQLCHKQLIFRLTACIFLPFWIQWNLLSTNLMHKFMLTSHWNNLWKFDFYHVFCNFLIFFLLNCYFAFVLLHIVIRVSQCTGLRTKLNSSDYRVLELKTMKTIYICVDSFISYIFSLSKAFLPQKNDIKHYNSFLTYIQAT